MKPTARCTVVVSSHCNRLGIEVRLERSASSSARLLRAYRLGEAVAERVVSRTDRETLGRSTTILDRSASVELRAALRAALDEGVRALRDGRGLCEAA
jgi:uncharacterized protein (DUF2336 family)